MEEIIDEVDDYYYMDNDFEDIDEHISPHNNDKIFKNLTIQLPSRDINDSLNEIFEEIEEEKNLSFVEPPLLPVTDNSELVIDLNNDRLSHSRSKHDLKINHVISSYIDDETELMMGNTADLTHFEEVQSFTEINDKKTDDPKSLTPSKNDITFLNIKTEQIEKNDIKYDKRLLENLKNSIKNRQKQNNSPLPISLSPIKSININKNNIKSIFKKKVPLPINLKSSPRSVTKMNEIKRKSFVLN